MKNILISILACAALLLVSCQRDNLEPAAQGQTVTYTVQVPTAISTKALGDDITGVTQLTYEVYREADINDMNGEPIYSGKETIDAEGKATFVLEFIKDQDFRVLFWAQNPGADMYKTDDLRSVTLSKTLVANNAEAAAFAGSDTVVKGVSTSNGKVDLVRPIAQLNIATTNSSLTIGNVTVDIEKSWATVKGLSMTYNVATKGVGADKTDFKYTVAEAPSDTWTFSATHTYVAMNYVGFAPESGTTVDVDFTIGTTEGDIEHTVSNVPVKPNYRTNIIGNLITAESDYNVTLNDDWDDEVKEVVVVKVHNAAGLQEAINNIPDGSEGNIILDGNIDLSALAGMISVKSTTKPNNCGLWIPAGKALVLDLNGCTISQTVEQTAGYSMILNHGTLTIDDSKGNGKISYTDSGNGGEYISDAIYNNGVLVINGGTIENLSSATVASNGYPHAVDTYSGIRNTSVTINGGTIYCAEYSAVRMFCVSATNTADLVINGGIIKGAIDMQNGTTLAAVGTLTINGGTFETTKNANNIRFANWNNGATEYGLTATIKGGEFNGGITTAYVPDAANWNKGIITGGTFVVDPTGFLADGYFTEQADGNYVVYKAVAAIGETMYKSLEEAIDAAEAEAEATITVLCDAEMAGNAEIAAGKTVVIDLNGCTISAVDNTEKNYQIILNKGNLTIKNSADNTAKMTVKATINSGWNRYSAVIANTVGGNLTVERNVVLEHLGGTDMAYGIDNLTNGKGTSAVTTINGATVKSPYRAVRQFLNGIEATNELYVKAGSELRGDNKSIFFHDPSKNANTGKLVVEEGAKLYGDVYLFVTAGSTEWPVEVSIAASTLADASEVLSGNVPSGYAIIKDNETWKVVDNAIATAEEFKAFRNKINAGEKFSDKTAYLVADIDLNGEEWTPIGTKDNHFHGIFDGQGHTISNFKITQKHDGDNAQAALFGTVSLTTVFKNFNIDNIQVLYPADYNGDYYGAAVIGTFYGNVTLQNINVTKSTIQGNNKVAGLIAHDGSSSKVLIENCNVNGCTIETKNAEDGGNVGGLVGLFQNTEATVKNCSVTGCTINAINSSDSGKRGNGLLIGGTIDSGTPDLYVKIENCKVSDNTFNETGRVNYVSPYGDGTLVGGAREDGSNVIGKVEIDGVVYPQN